MPPPPELLARAVGEKAPRVLAAEAATGGEGAAAAAVVGAAAVAQGRTCEADAVLPVDRNKAMSSPQSRLWPAFQWARWQPLLQ